MAPGRLTERSVSRPGRVMEDKHMYSIVLMAALSTGSGAPEFCHHGGGLGCAGYNSYGPYGPAPMVPEQIPPPKVEDKDKKDKGGTGSVAPDRAKVIVQLPADAKLYVDDQPIKAVPDNQVFSTPQLER